MAANYQKEQIGNPTAEAETAVYDLIKLCKYAVPFAKPLIHKVRVVNHLEPLPIPLF